MKKIVMSLTSLVLFSSAFGQAQESILPQQKKETLYMNAAKISLPYSPEVVIEILNMFVQRTLKGKKVKNTGYLYSDETSLEIKNKDKANMNFFVLPKEPSNVYETDLYLNLRSSFKDAKNEDVTYFFTMDDAKAYLDNFEKVAQAFAPDLQIKYLNKSLVRSEHKEARYEQKGKTLKERQDIIQTKADENNNAKKNERISKRLDHINQRIGTNIIVVKNENNKMEKERMLLEQFKDRAKN